jgi:DNA-directed RNA polymerase
MAAGEPSYVRAVNALQATPLAINGTVVDAVEWCFDEGKMFKKFPASKAPPRPVLPDNYDDLTSKVKAQHRAGLRKWHLKRREVVANRHCMNSDLATARDMQDYDQFYTPWNCDFRGRMYMLSTFNYHRADHIKAMFLFARGKPITDPKWLKVHIANTGDFNKVSKESFEDRVAWVDMNHDQLIACAEDYKASFGDWSRADKPFQFLAAVLAYKEFCDHGEGSMCYLPPSLDGTNSGTQHFAAAALNVADGFLVNLVPDGKCQDVYAVVAKAVEERVKQDLTSDKTLPYGVKTDRDGNVIERGFTPTLGDLARLWLDFKITRTVCKRSCMTFGYGSNQNGMYDQLMEDFMVPLERQAAYGKIKEHPFGDDHIQRDAARYLANIQYETIRKTLKSVATAMDYLRSLSEALSKENKVMRSTAASGFPVVQRYQKTKRTRVRVFLWDREAKINKRSQITLVEDVVNQIDSRKASNSASPNIIHSADAAHMSLTICAMLDEGIEDFFMIHDSFATQAADTDKMYMIVRQVFINIYGGSCFFQRLEAEVREQLTNPNAKLKPVPAKGNLDINKVLESRYCFS